MWYRQPLHFPSPSEEDGHNRLPDNTRTHRARSSRFFFFTDRVHDPWSAPRFIYWANNPLTCSLFVSALISVYVLPPILSLSLTTQSFLSLPSSVSPCCDLVQVVTPYPSLPPPTNLPLPHCLGGSLKCHLLCSLLYLGECCQIVVCGKLLHWKTNLLWQFRHRKEVDSPGVKTGHAEAPPSSLWLFARECKGVIEASAVTWRKNNS